MYRLLPRGVLRLADNRTITRDMVEWEDYRAWLKAGGVPEPEEVIIPPRWPDLDTARAAVWAACRLRRDTLEAAGFPYLGHLLDSDQRAVLRINTAAQAAHAALQAVQPFAIGWTCMDGHILDLGAAGMIGMPVALAMHANALHLAARQFKARIAAATGYDDLEQIEAEIAGAWVA